VNKLFIIIFSLTVSLIFVVSCLPKWPQNVLKQPINLYPLQCEYVDNKDIYARWTPCCESQSVDITYHVQYTQALEELQHSFSYETKDCCFLLPDLQPGIWYWQVTACQNDGTQLASPVWMFTVHSDSLPRPKNPASCFSDSSLMVRKITETGFELEWNEYIDPLYPFNPIEYRIIVNEKIKTEDMSQQPWVSDDTQTLRQVLEVTTTQTDYCFINLKPSTHYIWTIIASADTNRNSIVGNSLVKIGNHPPTQPELINPIENATEIATSITLNWSKSIDLDGDLFNYYVFMDTLSHTVKNLTPQGIQTNTYQPKDLKEGHTYYWFILVKDEHGAATRTQTNTFTTVTAANGLGIPTSPSPTDTSSQIDPLHPPALQWDHDPKGRLVRYNVYLSSDPKKLDILATGLERKSYQLNRTLKASTHYYWQIEAIDSQTGQSSQSAQWTFKTKSIAPPVQTNAQTDREGTRIVLTYDKAMADPSGKQNQYQIIKTPEKTNEKRQEHLININDISLMPGIDNQYQLCLSEKIEHGDCLAITYQPGNIQSADGSFLQAYTNLKVANQVPGTPPLIKEANIVPLTAHATSSSLIAIVFDKEMTIPGEDIIHQISVRVDGQKQSIQTLNRHSTENSQYLIGINDSHPVVFGQTVSFSYTKGTIQAENGAYLESATNFPVTNTLYPVEPNIQAIQMDHTGEQIIITFDRPMKALSDNQFQQFQILVNGFENEITGANLKPANPNILNLILKHAVGLNNTVHIRYTKGTVQSSDGAFLESFQNKPVDTTPLEALVVMKGVNWNFSTIQNAVEQAEDGDTIVVWPGTYEESIDFSSKNLHLKSLNPADQSIRETTIIKGAGQCEYVILLNEADQTTVIEGLTITRQHTLPGSGILILGGCPQIRYNLITQNNGHYGGGICIDYTSSPITENQHPVNIHHNKIIDNTATFGGGIYLKGRPDHPAIVRIVENLITQNDACSGGGIYVDNHSRIINENDHYWYAQMIPGTTSEISDAERTQVTNSLCDNTIDGLKEHEGANLYYHRTQTNPIEKILAHAKLDEIRIYGSFSHGDIARLFTHEASQSEIASQTYCQTAQTRPTNASFIAIEHDIELNTRYFITLQASDTHAYCQSTKTATLSINTPGCPNPATPYDGEHDIPKNPVITWESAQSAASYNLYLGTDYNDLALAKGPICETKTVLSGLLKNTTYYWKVEAIDVYGATNTSEVSSFTTDNTPFTGGTGEHENPYQIETWQQLSSIRDYPCSCFCLTTDLSSNTQDYETYASSEAYDSHGWLPIGDFTEPFQGEFSGNGHTISNLHLNRNTDGNGLFGYIEGATVQDITLDSFEINGMKYTGALSGRTHHATLTEISIKSLSLQSQSDYTGGLTGSFLNGKLYRINTEGTITSDGQKIGGLVGILSNIEMDSCHFKGHINSTNSSRGIHTGGLIGYGQESQVKNSSSAGSITVKHQYAGGFIGMGISSMQISACYSNISITGNIEESEYLGGFAGSIEGLSVLDNCYSTGDIAGLNFIGGFVGQVKDTARILNCYSTGKVSKEDYYCGGFAAINAGTISHCFWDIESSGIDCSFGSEGTDTTHMKKLETFEPEWDFDAIWQITEHELYHTYPFLRSNEQTPPPS